VTSRTTAIACWTVRIALALAFLSAVADRFGFWGPPGAPGVAWGSIANYEAYVAKLNWFVPPAVVPVLGWTATAAEVLIAIGLIIGWQLRWFALAAALLLTTFATAMAAALGPKAPLDYSVLSGASAAFLLFALLTQLKTTTSEQP
jgi:putative oxidoreductase